MPPADCFVDCFVLGRFDHPGANAGHQHGAADHDERAAAARELLEACKLPYHLLLSTCYLPLTTVAPTAYHLPSTTYHQPPATYHSRFVSYYLLLTCLL